MCDSFCIYPEVIEGCSITDNEREILLLYGFNVEISENNGGDEGEVKKYLLDHLSGGKVLLRNLPLPEWVSFYEEKKNIYGTENPWAAVLKNIILRSQKTAAPVECFVVRGTYGFEGYAYLVSAKDVKYFSTEGWIESHSK